MDEWSSPHLEHYPHLECAFFAPCMIIARLHYRAPDCHKQREETCFIVCPGDRLHEASHDVWPSRISVASHGEAMALHTPLTIGVIDDMPAFARGLAHVLRRDGGTVDTAAYGHLALAHLQAQRSDAVLCDLCLSGLDGPDCSGILCSQHASLRQRVMFLMGDTVGAESMAFLEPCGQPYLDKPYTVAEIRSAMAQRLDVVGPLPARVNASFLPVE